MFSFLVPVYRVLQGVAASWHSPAFRNAVGVIGLLLLSGTVFYTQVEGWRALDALYFSFVTLTTIGYGDLTPHSDAAKIFTMFYAAAGIGLFLKIIQILAQPAGAGRTGDEAE